MGKRNNPDYSQVTGLIDKDIARRLRVFCAEQDIEISEVMQKSIKDYLDAVQARSTRPSPGDVATVAELVQCHFWALTKAKIKNIDEIAQGDEPTKADLVRISSALGLDCDTLMQLKERSFPEKNEVNGCT